MVTLISLEVRCPFLVEWEWEWEWEGEVENMNGEKVSQARFFRRKSNTRYVGVSLAVFGPGDRSCEETELEPMVSETSKKVRERAGRVVGDYPESRQGLTISLL